LVTDLKVIYKGVVMLSAEFVESVSQLWPDSKLILVEMNQRGCVCGGG
jgi:hypothetical protein